MLALLVFTPDGTSAPNSTGPKPDTFFSDCFWWAFSSEVRIEMQVAEAGFYSSSSRQMPVFLDPAQKDCQIFHTRGPANPQTNKNSSLAPKNYACKGANTMKLSNTKISSQDCRQLNTSCIQLKCQIWKSSQPGANGLVLLFDSYCFSFVYSYVTCQQNLLCSWTVCGTLISRRTALLLLLPGAVSASPFICQALIVWLSLWVALVTFNNPLLLHLGLSSAKPLHTCLHTSDWRDSSVYRKGVKRMGSVSVTG